MKVNEAAARQMCTAMGLEAAEEWSLKTLVRKLNKLYTILDVAKSPPDEADATLLKTITEALDSGEEISLEEELDSEEPEDDDNPENAPESPIPEKPKKKVKDKTSKEPKDKPKKATTKAENNGTSPDKKPKVAKAEGDKPKKEKKPRAPRKDRPTILGFSATAVSHWMGLNGYVFADIRKVLNNNGCKDIADASIKTSLSDCKSEKYSKPADVNATQAKQIKAWVKG